MKKLLFTFFYSLSALACMAQASFFDPSFGTGGKVIMDNSSGVFEAIKVQPDGRIIVAGVMTTGAVIGRFKENGSPDSSFGVNGFYISPTWSTHFYSILLQADGKIVAEGNREDSFLTVRLNSDGTPDITFGGSGGMTTSFGVFTDSYGKTLTIQADSKIVIGGETSPSNMGLVRLHVNGIVDSSFGTNGLVVGPYGRANGIDINIDGKIVAGGHATASHDYALLAVRYLADGTLDTTFNHTGIVYTIAGDPDGNFGKAVKVQPDGKVLLAGSGSFGTEGGNFVVVRYNTDGSLDGSFGNGGIASIDFYGQDDGASGMDLAPDGKIVLSGSSVKPGHIVEVAIARLNNDGTLDNSFGNAGRILNPLRDWNDNGIAVALQTDGKVVVAGNSYRDVYPNNYCDPFLVRYLPGASEINVFGAIKTEPLLYPNPASQDIYIGQEFYGHVTDLRITDIMGKEIDTRFNGRAVNVAGLPDGLYFFRVAFNDGTAAVERVWVRN
jgi:uncharacterized delta-60 repeat protein